MPTLQILSSTLASTLDSILANSAFRIIISCSCSIFSLYVGPKLDDGPLLSDSDGFSPHIMALMWLDCLSKIVLHITSSGSSLGAFFSGSILQFHYLRMYL